MNTLHNHVRILFATSEAFDLLKATIKKMITVPGHMRDGQWIGPFQKTVHYNPDVSHHDVAHGNGSHAQKVAHKELSAHSWFHALPTVDEKAMHVMSLATEKQEKNSAAAAVTYWKQQAVTGKNPTPGMWAAFLALPGDKQAKLYDDVKAAKGDLSHLKSPAGAEVTPKTEPESAPQAVAEEPAAKDDALVQDWAKAANAGENPTPEQWVAFHSLPWETQAKHYDAAKEQAGGLSHLKMSQEPPAPDLAKEAHTEWVKKIEANGAKKITLEGKEWYLLNTGAKDGQSTYAHLASVDKGSVQGNGWNPQQSSGYFPSKDLGIEDAKPAAAESSPTPGNGSSMGYNAPKSALEVKTFTHSKKGHEVFSVPLPGPKLNKDKYDAVAKLAKQAGGFFSSFKGDGAIPGFHFKDENDAQAFAVDAGEHLGLGSSKDTSAGEFGQAPSTQPVAAPVNEPKKSELEIELNSSGFKVCSTHGIVKLAGNHGNYPKSYANKTQANAKVNQLKAAGFDAHVSAMHPFSVVINGKSQAEAAVPDTGPKDGDTKPGEHGNTLTLKNGHWLDLGAEKLKHDIFNLNQAGSETKAHSMAMDYVIDNGTSKYAFDVAIEALEGAGYKSATSKIKAFKSATDAIDSVLVKHPAPATGPKVAPEGAKFSAAYGNDYTKKDGAWVSQNGFPLNPDNATSNAAEILNGGQMTPGFKGKSDTAKEAAAEAIYLVGKDLGWTPEKALSAVFPDSTDGHEAGFEAEKYKLSGGKWVKQVEAAAAVSPTAPAVPQAPEFTPGSVFADDVEKMLQAMLFGDFTEVDAVIKLTENLPGASSQKMAKYAKEVKAWMQSNKSPVQGGAKPVPPTAPAGTISGTAEVFDSVIHTLGKHLDAGEVENIKTTASLYDGLNSATAKAITKYAAECLAHLGAGPKNGDTKMGESGIMLVFQDGYWHRVKQAEKPEDAAKQEEPAKPKYKALAPKMAISTMAGPKTAKGNKDKFKAWAVAGDGASLQAWLDDGKNSGMAGSKIVVKKLLYAMQDPNTPIAAPKTAAPKVTGVSSVLQSTTSEGAAFVPYKPGLPNVSDWEQTGPQKGSNPGGKFKDKKGKEWYCKFPEDENMAKSELLTAKFYQMMGIAVPNLKLVSKDGKVGIASEFIDGLSKGSSEQLGKANGAHGAFAIDAWLANWDVVGLSNDNLMLDKSGKAVRVDVGGSLDYRAQGGLKGGAFGNDVQELDTLIDPSKNDKSAAVFGNISKADLEASGKVLAKLAPDQIKELCRKIGPGTAGEKIALADKLIARRASILSKLGIKDPWDIPKVDKTKLKIDPSVLPKAIDFGNFNGPGKGLSGAAHVNELNTKDSQALIDFAAKGNLEALEKYQYDAVDKSTGKSVGKKPVAEHPSTHVKNQWASLCDLLSAIACPPVLDAYNMPAIGGGAAEEVFHEAGYMKITDTINNIAQSKKLGYWMKLGNIDKDDIEDMKPSKITYFKQSMEAAAKKWYAGLKGATSKLITNIQGSGYWNRFWTTGVTTIDLGGAYNGGVQTLAATLYDDAIGRPEGTTIMRWMDVEQDMVDKLMQEGAGLVFQNSDSMCCSTLKNWGDQSHFGAKAFLNIHYAEGAKALESYANGSFKSTTNDSEGHYLYKHSGNEREVTTLPGSRFVVLGVKKGNSASSGGITLDLLMLPPHQGYIAELEKGKQLGKSLVMFFQRFAKKGGLSGN